MAPLDKEEINAQLIRLGIVAPLEREACLNEYVEYLTNNKSSLLDRLIRTLKIVFSRFN
jgi:hypothetical protein